MFDLFQALRKDDVFIVLVTGAFTALAVIYALIAMPIYQAYSSIVSPLAEFTQGYIKSASNFFVAAHCKA